jgi:hypothetical protein
MRSIENKWKKEGEERKKRKEEKREEEGEHPSRFDHPSLAHIRVHIGSYNVGDIVQTSCSCSKAHGHRITAT